MKFQQQCSCQRRSEQKGFISLLALLQMLVLLAFGMGILYFAQTGMKNTTDYQQETAMRLRIQGEVERDGRENLEVAGSQASALSKKTEKIEAPYRIVITRKSKGDEVYLIGVIFAMDDNAGERHKMAKGLWQKEGNRYVFQGWVP